MESGWGRDGESGRAVKGRRKKGRKEASWTLFKVQVTFPESVVTRTRDTHRVTYSLVGLEVPGGSTRCRDRKLLRACGRGCAMHMHRASDKSWSKLPIRIKTLYYIKVHRPS